MVTLSDRYSIKGRLKTCGWLWQDVAAVVVGCGMVWPGVAAVVVGCVMVWPGIV